MMNPVLYKDSLVTINDDSIVLPLVFIILYLSGRL